MKRKVVPDGSSSSYFFALLSLCTDRSIVLRAWVTGYHLPRTSLRAGAVGEDTTTTVEGVVEGVATTSTTTTTVVEGEEASTAIIKAGEASATTTIRARSSTTSVVPLKDRAKARAISVTTMEEVATPKARGKATSSNTTAEEAEGAVEVVDAETPGAVSAERWQVSHHSIWSALC